jgi:hypothetical protein
VSENTRRTLFRVTVIVFVVAIGAWLWSMRHWSRDVQRDLDGARTALQAGETERAAELARSVLAREPLEGKAFAILAQALADQGTEQEVLARYRIAVRRAPRDVHVRTWLAARALKAGEYPEAADHLEALLTVSRSQRPVVLGVLAGLVADPAFAEALAAHLERFPQWQGAILQRTLAEGSPEAKDTLHGALRRHGLLDAQQTGRWLDALMKEGRWGVAYAHWVSGLPPGTTSIPMPWNGDFAQRPSSMGFDWRLRRTNGVVAEHVAEGGGHAMRLEFLGRPVASPGLEVPLLLAPGTHTVSLRMRAPQLRSDQGLEWQATCSDGRTRVGQGARIHQAVAWQDYSFDVDVPQGAHCEGQWLRLVNPAPKGVAQTLRGAIKVTDVHITTAVKRA